MLATFAATPKLPAGKSSDARIPAGTGADFKPIDPGALAAVQGWTDLLRDPKLGDWLRVSVPADKANAPRSPWRHDASTGILSFDGSAPEMLLHQMTRGDGVLHVQWRFPGEPAKPTAGALVRTKADGSAWFEGQLSPGTLGSLAGSVAGADGKPRRFTSGARRPDLLRKKADEWNVTEITCLGKRLMLRMNGVLVADWDGCTVPVAHVGVQGGESPIEFRAIKFKAVP